MTRGRSDKSKQAGGVFSLYSHASKTTASVVPRQGIGNQRDKKNSAHHLPPSLQFPIVSHVNAIVSICRNPSIHSSSTTATNSSYDPGGEKNEVGCWDARTRKVGENGGEKKEILGRFFFCLFAGISE